MKLPSLSCALLFATTEVLSWQTESWPRHWVDIWTASPQLSREVLPASVTNANGYFNDATIRQTLHMTLATDKFRVRLSNVYGTTVLGITAASATLTRANDAGNTTGEPTIDVNTLHKLTFMGNSSINIPIGASIVSDPVQLSVGASQDLTVSLYLAKGQIGFDTTSHDVSHTTSWLAPGYQTMQVNVSSDSISVPSWYYVTAVEAWLSSEAGAMICVGDSITDGTGSTMNGNLRWVDDLFRRMQQNPETQNIAVLNADIGGNHLDTDPGQGPNAVARIGRDILAQPGIRYVTILDGVNDIGHTVATDVAQDELYHTLVAGLDQFIAQVHAFGLPVFGATLTPFHDPPYSIKTSNYSNPFREVTRNRLNDWIVNHSKFDYVVDYAGATANKTNPDQFQDQYAFTNYLHPNDLGHRAMAGAWDLSVFKKFSQGVSGYS